MVPAYYLDITLQPHGGSDSVLVRELGEAYSLAWRLLHAVATHLTVPFAVGFPDYGDRGFLGHTLRVYVAQQDQALHLGQTFADLRDENQLENLFSVPTLPRKVSPSHGPWRAFVMKRLPKPRLSRKTDPAQAEQVMAQRQQRKLRLHAQQLGLPYIWMTSSTGQRFKLVIEQVLLDTPQTGDPNGYGLSRASGLVALPIDG